ncbi:MAG: tetratricopeptide repeat protein [Paludibacteraceae bacterium]|nr:tetratricopeptide repeat protein [Bacteroidales bacterium]MDY4513606.1 tetratricopeptide repeat protein [Paludibacteraceae bacterium]
MKKTLIMAALVLISAGCFAQKANVKKAKNLALQETPDFSGARAAINEALTNEETKDLADTWYTAGLIGYQELSKENEKTYLGQARDEKRAGEAVVESFDYWMKAADLAGQKVLDKKGNEVLADKKTYALLQKKVLEYYKNQELVKYGIYLNDQRDFATAYGVFQRHLSIPELSLMQNEKLQKEMPKDSIYDQYKYYTAIFAIQAEMHPEAIAVLEEMKDGNYEAITVNQFLYQEYVNVQDTANYVRVLQDAVVRFPQEPWFLQNLINHYIFSGQEQEAINYLDQAIAREPNVAQYHLIKGNLNENQKNYEAALADFDRALAIDPTMADAEAGKGRVYYNQAVKMNEDAALIADAKEYKKALEEMNAMFRQSMPFFEKAHELAPDNRDYMITLRGLYYRFDMTDKYNAINEELNK